LQQLDEQRNTDEAAESIGKAIVELTLTAGALLPALHVATPAEIQKAAALMRAAEEVIGRDAAR
jgi:hypothetical protein